MKCTSILCDSRKHLFQLFLDEDEWHKVHVSIFGRRPSISGETIVECEEVFTKLEYQGAKRFVLKRLSLRSYHSLELSAALSERLVSKETIERVLEEYSSMGYLNDQEWVASTVQRLQLQKCGPRAIEMKLRAKGLPKESIQNAIASICKSSSQQENINRLLTSRYRSRDMANPKEKQKVIAGLMRKGYAYDQINAALRGLNAAVADDDEDDW
jgi:regulatory protein